MTILPCTVTVVKNNKTITSASLEFLNEICYTSIYAKRLDRIMWKEKRLYKLEKAINRTLRDD
jgi:hypothetical protein